MRPPHASTTKIQVSKYVFLPLMWPLFQISRPKSKPRWSQLGAGGRSPLPNSPCQWLQIRGPETPLLPLTHLTTSWSAEGQNPPSLTWPIASKMARSPTPLSHLPIIVVRDQRARSPSPLTDLISSQRSEAHKPQQNPTLPPAQKKQQTVVILLPC